MKNGTGAPRDDAGEPIRERYRRKPGDRVIRIHTVRPYQMRRVLGVPALYSAGYGNVGSSIYYALGVIALVAVGATPVVLLAAGGLFFLTALVYAEGSAMFPEAGGSAAFARHAFNDLMGLASGWALMLSYIVTISISAFIIPPYLGYFWEPLKASPVWGTALAMGIIAALALINVLGVREASLVNILAAGIDLLTQLFLIFAGVVFLFNPQLLTQRIVGYWPSPANLVFGFALASLAYTGVETVSQMAEETRRAAVRVPRALMLMVVTVLVMFTGVTLVAFSVMTPEELASRWARDPVAGIAYYLPLRLSEIPAPQGPVAGPLFLWFVEAMHRFLPPLVGLLAATILLIATNAGLIGISRLAFSLGRHRQLPEAFSRIHYWFRTPYLSILIFSAVAVALLAPGFIAPHWIERVTGRKYDFLTSLGALYAFGSTLTFALAFLSIFALRWRFPHLPRPFHKGPILHFWGRQVHLVALLGLATTAGVWGVVIYLQPYAGYVGLAWMAAGLLFYALFRRLKRLPLLSTPPDSEIR